MKEEKSFICNQCGKRFHSLKAVTGHKHIHSLKTKKKLHLDEGLKGEMSKLFKVKRLSTIHQYAKLNDHLSCTYDDIEQEVGAALGLMMLSNGFANLDSLRGIDPKVDDICVDWLMMFSKKDGCGESDSGQSSLDLGKNKWRDNSRRKTHKCSVCFKEFGSGPSLGGHMNIHKDHKCSVCFKQFASGEALEDHKRAHCAGSGLSLGGHVQVHLSKVHKCSICFKEFGSGEALGGHKRAHYNVLTKSKDHKRSVCFKEFGSEEALEDHKRAHCDVLTKSKDHKCSVCFKEFGSEEALENHKRAHCDVLTKSKDHICSVCFKEFGSGETLEDHKRAHCNVLTKSKDHKCSVCFKELGSAKSIGAHMRVRSSSKNHKCLVCFKEFVTTQGLGKHRRSHYNVKTSSKECLKESTADALDICEHSDRSRHGPALSNGKEQNQCCWKTETLRLV